MSEFNFDNISENSLSIGKNEQSNYFFNEVMEQGNNTNISKTSDQTGSVPINIISRKREFPDNSKENEKKRKRRKYQRDNILIKIQCHYMTFIIKFVNNVLDFLDVDKNDRFKDIQHSFKKDIKKDQFNSLKTAKLHEIITQAISKKNKNNNIKPDEHYNINLYKKLSKNEIIKNLLNENYLNLFQKVYYKSERFFNLKEYGKDVVMPLSDNIEMYKNIEIKDKEYDKKYINIIDAYIKKSYFASLFKIKKTSN